MLFTLSWNVFQPRLYFSMKRLQFKDTDHTPVQKMFPSSTWLKKRKGHRQYFKHLLLLPNPSLYIADIEVKLKCLHNHKAKCQPRIESWPKLTLRFFVWAKSFICSSSEWQCHTFYCLVFVPWALHSSCANLRLVMTAKLLLANEISLRSKVRGGLSCAKPFQYLRPVPLKRRLMWAHTCYLFANVHMMCKPFHPSAWHSWSVRTNPSRSLTDPCANFVPRSGLINLFMWLIKSYNAWGQQKKLCPLTTHSNRKRSSGEMFGFLTAIHLHS